MDLLDVFYKDIQMLLNSQKESIINKNFVNKQGPLELVPINMAKGELKAVQQTEVLVARLYKKYKADLNTVE